MNRRNFLKLSSTGALSLSTIGLTASLTGCSQPTLVGWKILRPEDLVIFKKLVPVILKGNFPTEPTAFEQASDKMLRMLDEAIYQIGPFQSNQMIQLLDLLHFGPTKSLLAGIWGAWENQSEDEIEAFLQNWRHSSMGLLTAAYNGITKLTASLWFGLPEGSAQAGYSGPKPGIATALGIVTAK